MTHRVKGNKMYNCFSGGQKAVECWGEKNIVSQDFHIQQYYEGEIKTLPDKY